MLLSPFISNFHVFSQEQSIRIKRDTPYYHGVICFQFLSKAGFAFTLLFKSINKISDSVVSDFEFLGPSNLWSTFFSMTNFPSEFKLESIEKEEYNASVECGEHDAM